MYLTAIIDWFSRKIIGWTLSDTLDTEPVLECVKAAAERFGITAILKADRGSKFTSDEYKALLKQYGIRQSMDGKSRWADNVRIERWFRSLKTELIYINEFDSLKLLRRAIHDYIQQYNTQHPHQALDYATPEDVYSCPFLFPDADLDWGCRLGNKASSEVSLTYSCSRLFYCYLVLTIGTIISRV